ncbi:Amino acid-polyamine-organocation, partial [Globisporangium splendens]
MRAPDKDIEPQMREPMAHTLTGRTERISSLSTPSDASQFVVMEDSDVDGVELNAETADGTDPRKERVLTAFSLLALCFFAICGGPVGSEPIVTGMPLPGVNEGGSGGPAAGIMALTLFPILFYVPMSLLVTELVSAIPGAGGHAYWIALAFGPQCGFQAGYWSWVANCINCALFSSIAVSSFVGSRSVTEDRSTTEEILRQGLPIFLAIPGFLSLRRVGHLVSVVFVGVMLPYTALTIWGFIAAKQWSVLGEFRYKGTVLGLSSSSSPSSISWGTISSSADDASSSHSAGFELDYVTMITSLIWNYHGFHNLSVFATEVQDPVSSYRRVMLFSFLLIPLTYLVPVIAAVANNHPPWTEWVDGSIGDVVLTFGGTPMYVLVVAMMFFSTMGLYLTSLISSAFLASGMADKRFAPAGLGITAQSTTHGAILCSLPVILIIVNVDSDDMVRISNALGGLGSITLILAAIRLRFTMRGLHRPTKLCGDLHPVFMILALLFPMACLGFSTVYAFRSLISGTLATVFVLIGFVYGKQGNFSKFQRE